MQKTRTFIMVVFLALAAFLPAVHFFGSGEVAPVEAQADPPGDFHGLCKPADLFVVVDQSTSMFNSDPQNLRLDAIKNLIDRLYLNAALRCPGETYRLSVIGFGTRVQTMIDLTDIQVDDIESDWQGEAERLKTRLTSLDLDQTDHALALSNEVSGVPNLPWLLGQAGQESGLEQEPRKQAVVLVTDGMPCTIAAYGKGFCGSPEWVEHYFYGNQPRFLDGQPSDYGFSTPSGLINALNNVMPPSPANPSLYVLSFSENAAPWDFVDRAWTKMAEDRRGRYIPPADIDTNSKITGEIDKILSDVLETKYQLVSCTTPFYLEPYVSSTTIISSIRPTSDLHLILLDPDGNTIALGNVPGNAQALYSAGESFERYVIPNPRPGAWSIQLTSAECGKLEISFETINPITSFETLPQDVVVNLDSPYYLDDNSKAAELVVRGSLGDLFVQDSDYKLTVCGTVTPVGNIPGAAEALREEECLGFSYISPGIWRSDHPLPAPRQGTYRLSVKGTVQAIDPAITEPINLFTLDSITLPDGTSGPATYETAKPLDVKLEFVKPDGQFLPLNNFDTNGNSYILPIDVAARVVTGNGIAQSASRVFYAQGLAKKSVEAVLYNSVNIEVERITLEPSETDPTLLVGQMQAGDDAQRLPGPYSIRLEMTQDAVQAYNRDNYKFGATATEALTFERRQRQGVKLVGLKPTGTLNLNRIEGSVAVNVPIEVQARLENTEGTPLQADDIFENGSAGLFRAILIGPNNLTEPIVLTPSAADPRLLTGVFRENAVAIDSPGQYTVQFTMGAADQLPTYDTTRYVFLNLETSLNFTRQQIYGVTLEGLNPVAGAMLDLNTVSGFTQVGTSVEVQVRFVDPTIQIPVNANNPELGTLPSPYLSVTQPYADVPSFIEAEHLENGLQDVVYAIIEGPQGIRQEKSLDYNPATGVFFGNLRTDTNVIDPAGDYTITFKVNPDALTVGPGTQFNVIEDKHETDPVSFKRREVVALKLRVIYPPARVLLNKVVEGKPVNVPVDVEVELVDHANDPLVISDVFDVRYDLNGLVEAVLYPPDETGTGQRELEGIALTPLEGDNSTRWAGTLRQTVTEPDALGNFIDPAGNYTVQFAFTSAINGADYDMVRYVIEEQNRAVTQTFERSSRNGVSVVLVEPAQDAYWLNKVDTELKEQTSLSVPVSAQLVNLDGSVYSDPTVFAGTDLSDLVTASISKPGGVQQSIPLTWNAATQRFEGILRTDGSLEIDAPGDYTVTLTLNRAKFSTDALAEYEPVAGQDSVTKVIRRNERRGIFLKLVEIGGESASESGKSIKVPLYLSWQDAFGGLTFWNGPVEAPVPVKLQLLDTNDQTVSWKDLVPNPDTTTINEVLSVSFTVDSGEEIFLRDLEETGGGDDPYVITGLIDSEATSSGTYTINYRLNTSQLEAATVTNFTGSTQSASFYREITGIHRNPTSWVVLRWIALVVGTLFFGNFYRVNFRYPMRGTLYVKYKEDRQGHEEPIKLGGLKFFRRHKTHKYSAKVGASLGQSIPTTVRIDVTSGKASSQMVGGAKKPTMLGGVPVGGAPVQPQHKAGPLKMQPGGAGAKPEKKTKEPPATSYKIKLEATEGKGKIPHDVELAPGGEVTKNMFEVRHQK